MNYLQDSLLQIAVKKIIPSLEHGLGRGAFCDCFGSSGAACVLAHYISHLISFSPCCAGVLWHGLAQQPAGRPESPLLPCLQEPERGRAVCRDRLLPAAGKILKHPHFCSWPLVYIFIKMLVFNIQVLFSPVNNHAGYLNFIEANSFVLHRLGMN